MNAVLEPVGEPILAIEAAGHAYLGRTVLDAASLDIAAGEVVALVGPSGCGKSTLAHIAAGILTPLRGTVRRRYRRHGMVFQEPRLLPWATARGNIAYPLRLAGIGRRERTERVAWAAAEAALLPDDLDKYPVELSGGMRQRVAIARAIVREPDFVYFDEPFTALDVALRRRLQDLVIRTARQSGFGALFITHDLAEAARIAHRIAVMESHGRGIAGERPLPGKPGERSDALLFEIVGGSFAADPVFRHLYDVDERRL